MEEKPLKTLEDRIRELEEQVEVLAQQVQKNARFAFLVTAKFLGGRLPLPDKTLAGKLTDLAIPGGFVVRLTEGPDCGKTSLILGSPPPPPPNGRAH